MWPYFVTSEASVNDLKRDENSKMIVPLLLEEADPYGKPFYPSIFTGVSCGRYCKTKEQIQKVPIQKWASLFNLAVIGWHNKDWATKITFGISNDHTSVNFTTSLVRYAWYFALKIRHSKSVRLTQLSQFSYAVAESPSREVLPGRPQRATNQNNWLGWCY